MSAQAEDVVSVADIIKLVVTPLLVVVGVAGFYYFADLQALYRVLLLVVSVALSAGVFFSTAKGRAVWGFVLEAKQEVKRVVWPTRDEALRTTILVSVMVVVVALILWLLDTFLVWAIQTLMSQGAH